MVWFLETAILTCNYLPNPEEDSEDESSSDSSPPAVTRRSKFDDEEDDSDVRRRPVSLFRKTSSSRLIRFSSHGMRPRIPTSSVRRPKKQLRPKSRQRQRQLQTRSQRHRE